MQIFFQKNIKIIYFSAKISQNGTKTNGELSEKIVRVKRDKN